MPNKKGNLMQDADKNNSDMIHVLASTLTILIKYLRRNNAPIIDPSEIISHINSHIPKDASESTKDFANNIISAINS